METRTIAQGQLEVSAVCMGCWPIVGDSIWGPQEKADSIATIRASLEAGVTFFDSAEGYGDGYSERLLCEALGADREKVVVASKAARGHLGAADLPAACERSLTNLGTDYLDLYYIHWPNWEIPFAETVGAMERLKAAGKVRHMAVSNFGRRDLAEIAGLSVPACDQLAYNLLWRPVEAEILPACRAADVVVTCYCPLMQGLLTGKFASADEVPFGRTRARLFRGDRRDSRHGEAGAEAETFAAVAAIRAVAKQAGLDMGLMSLAWLLAREPVASVIVGARTAGQARHNAAAGDLKLPADVIARLEEITDPLRRKLGTNADLWQGGANSRIR
jgi:aryl-alcohol dehydrogenase-like predicted oxidoreductase